MQVALVLKLLMRCGAACVVVVESGDSASARKPKGPRICPGRSIDIFPQCLDPHILKIPDLDPKNQYLYFLV